MADRAHWDERYRAIGTTQVSWFEPAPRTSLELLDALGVTPDQSVIDVGGGASTLVDHLLGRGHGDVAVLDISSAALDAARQRLDNPDTVTWINAGLLTWVPPRHWNAWHDRAVLHFLTTDEQRSQYAERLAAALEPGGAFVLGAFALDGPTHCSGLEVRRQSFDDLAELAGDAEVVEARRQVHHTPAGGEQPFNWIAGRRR